MKKTDSIRCRVNNNKVYCLYVLPEKMKTEIINSYKNQQPCEVMVIVEHEDGVINEWIHELERLG